MNRKMIFLDIDSTLYSHKTWSIPHSASEACRRAQDQGHILFLCSGRSPLQTGEFRRLDWIKGQVCCDGAYAEAEGKVIFRHPLEDGSAAYLNELAEACRANLSMHGLDENFTNTGGLAFYREWFAELAMQWKKLGRKGELPKLPQLYEKAYQEQPIYMVDVFFRKDSDRDSFVKGLEGRYSWAGILSTAENSLMGGEITAPGIHKGTGMLKAAAYYGISQADTIAFGDSANDTEMLKAAGVGVAMGNGAAAAKEAADWVTDDIEEDGLAHAFMKLGLNG